MPSLPKGMFLRRRSGETRGTYYTRRRTSDGKRVWIALGDSLEDARKALKEARARTISRGTNATVAAITEEWLRSYVPTKRTPRNARSTTKRTRTYAIPYFEQHRKLAREVTEDDLRLYRRHLEGKGLEPGTVRLYLADMLCMFRWAASRKAALIAEKPFDSGKDVLPQLPEEKPKRITEEEAERAKALPGDLGFTVRFLLGTGLRWSEAIRAQAGDIENGKLVVERTKGRKVRRIPLPPDLLEECRTRGGKLIPFDRDCSDAFNRQVRTQAAIPGFHAHRCRHTFAYRWLEHGGSLATLQRVLGHTSLEMTMRYASPDDDLVEREAERVFRAQVGSRWAAAASKMQLA